MSERKERRLNGGWWMNRMVPGWLAGWVGRWMGGWMDDGWIDDW